MTGSRSKLTRTPGKVEPPSGGTASAARGSTPALRVQQTAGNQTTGALFDAAGPHLQGRDRDERQAERAADAGLTTPVPTPSRPSHLPRMDGLGDSTAEARASSEPLPPSVRADLEPRLGFDLGAVRIGRGPEASAVAAAHGARALTVGRNVVFGRDEFEPTSTRGRALIAHELVHVLQQAGSGRALVQRAPIERWIDVPRLDWTGKQQEPRETKDYVPSGAVLASYDPDTGVLRCTFQLRWSLEKELDKPGAVEVLQRRFEQAVKTAWEHRYTLVEQENDEPTGRSAEVELAFKTVDRDEPSSRRYDVEMTGYPRRSSVRSGSDVFLSTWDFEPPEAPRKPFSAKDYPENATPKQGTGRAYSQVVAAHEFGHMIGLGDEYPLTQKDLADLRAAQPERAEEELKRRNKGFSDRIMNVGSEITPDSYAPFALWLSRLTGRKWVVGAPHRVEPGKEPRKPKVAP